MTLGKEQGYRRYFKVSSAVFAFGFKYEQINALVPGVDEKIPHT